MLKSFVRTGTLKVIDADGKSHIFSGAPGPKVTMRLTDRSLYHKLFLNPELHAGEAYMDGRMQLRGRRHSGTFSRFSRSIARRSAPIRLQKVLRAVSRGLKRFQQANPVGKAQKNVAHHYDLGNDFYKLFLDEGMNYSCAYFLNDDETPRAGAAKQAPADRSQAASQAWVAGSSISAAAGAILHSISRPSKTSTSRA